MITASVEDIRAGMRGLARAKGFAAAAIVTLSLGAAGITVMFGILDGVLLQPLPVRDQDRLVVVWKQTAQGTFAHYPFGQEAIEEVRQHARLLERIGAFSYNGAMQFVAVENDTASYITAGAVDGHFFETLGVTPLAGRLLTPEDNREGAEPVLVIDEHLWQRRYARAADVVGRRLRIEGHTYRIVGIAPSIGLPKGSEAWLSMEAYAGRVTGTPRLGILRDQDFVARLRPGVTIAQATSELDNLTIEYETRFGRDILSSVRPLTQEVVGDVRTPVLTLFGAVLLLLLIATANFASLLLLRGEGQWHEFGVRTALGARRVRLVRQIVGEALLLGLGASLAGLLVGRWALETMKVLAPADVPRLDGVTIDLTVAMFVVSSTVGAVLVAACAAALVSTGHERPLAAAASRVTPSMLRHSRRGLVVAQVALSLTILGAAGVLTRTLLNLVSADIGLDAERLAFVELFLPSDGFAEPAARRTFFDELITEAGALPGVDSITAVAVRPYAGLSGWDMPRWVSDGQSADEAAANPGLDLQSIYPEHFSTMGIAILEGRAIDERDREGSQRAAVISANAARQVWPNESAIGKRVKWGGLQSDGPWFTIVGVAETTRYRELAEPRASLYLPAAQFVDGANSLALRLSAPLELVTPAIRERVRRINPDVLLIRTQSFSAFLARPLARPRFVAWLSNVFGVAAALLAAIGLYGVLAAFVRQSSREIGVRVALGASSRDVRRLVFSEAARLTGVGFLLGIAGVIATGGLLRGLVFGVQPSDPWTIAIVAASLAAIAGLACYVPVRRATRVDPVTLLRSE